MTPVPTAQITEFLLSQASNDLKRELGRFVVPNTDELDVDYYSMWVIKEDERSVFEQTVTADPFPNVQIAITFCNPRFILDVVEENPEVSFWQLATVIRIMKTADIVYDPKGFLTKAAQRVISLKWSPDMIRQKREIALMLLDKALSFYHNEAFGDAVIWLLKAAEEAFCIPLMIKNTFNITTPRFMLEVLRETDPFLYQFYRELLGISNQTEEKVIACHKELEMLAERLFRTNKRKQREMWILTAYVSLNECERYLQMLSKVADLPEGYYTRLMESAIAELWQAYFLIAQTPWDRMSSLDQYIVASFWKWFFEWRGFDFSETSFRKIVTEIEKIATSNP